MPTAQQTQHARGFARAIKHAGVLCVFGDDSFKAIVSPVKADPLQVEALPDQLVEIVALTADLPATPPKENDVITADSIARRITLPVVHDTASGLTTFKATNL